MNRLSSSTFMFSIFFLLIILLGTSYHFFTEMNNTYILIQSGNTPVKRITNNYKFLQNKRGLIFSITFLFSAASLAVMVLLPTSEQENYSHGLQKPTPGTPKPKGMASDVKSQTTGEHVDLTQEPMKPVEKEDSHKDDIENELDLLDDNEEFADDTWAEVVEGEDDVVYGSEQITGAAIMDFVHKFPDSALKFLYRKQLNGKPLPREDEEIYNNWEQRGMSRSKVKHYILSLMEWEKLPKDALYDIWKQLRDHIYDAIE
ncbi:MAG: hypothetical protein GY786_05955 [Proteobacteria bacterium]|nr:hypothetical protein [Pseudomonadota bacterium]